MSTTTLLVDNQIKIKYGEDSEQVYTQAFYIITYVLPDKVLPSYGNTVMGFLDGSPITVVSEGLFHKAVSLINNSGYETIPGSCIRRLLVNPENPELRDNPYRHNRAYWNTSSHLSDFGGNSRRDLRWMYADLDLNTVPYNLRRNNTTSLSLEVLNLFLDREVVLL